MARALSCATMAVLALLIPVWSHGSERSAPRRRSGVVDVKVNGPPPSPLLFNSKGCSSSTATQALARSMLKAHGVDVWTSAAFEDLQPEKMRILQEMPEGTSVPQGLEASIMLAASKGKTYFTKMSEYNLRNVDIQRVLHSNQARIVNVWRSNVLDYLVCSVNDCFLSKEKGQQVLPNGTEVNLCFRRRKAKLATQVKLNPKTLVDTLSRFLKSDRQQAWSLEQAGYRSFLTVATEDLLACERDEDLVTQSVEAWSVFLSSLSIPVDRVEVRRVIHEHCDVGSRPFEPHSKTIYNFEEVASVLRKAMDPMIRNLLRK